MAKSDKLPIMKDGDTLDGTPCIIPASLRWCHVCDCLRRDADGWTIKRDEFDFEVHICPRHEEGEP